MNVLEVNKLYKKIGKKQIIKNISFSIKEGEIFGLVGPNDAGKTTTVKMLLSLISPSKGSIKIFGYDISRNRSFALKDVGSVIDPPELYTYMSGKQNLKQILRMSGNVNKDDINEIIKLVGLENKIINTKVKKYSLEMKQRLALAEALLIKPKLLILDEPTDGLNSEEIIEFKNIINNYVREKNITVFITSRNLNDIQEICDTISFIDNGTIKSIDSVDSITAATTEEENETDNGGEKNVESNKK